MSDEELIRATALDYFDGWYAADLAQIGRAMHPELVKRWVGKDQGDPLNPTRTYEGMLQLVREGGGVADRTDDPIEITVVDIHRDIAAVVVRSAEYREYLHLVRTPAGWKIVNALWDYTKPPA